MAMVYPALLSIQKIKFSRMKSFHLTVGYDPALQRASLKSDDHERLFSE